MVSNTPQGPERLPLFKRLKATVSAAAGKVLGVGNNVRGDVAATLVNQETKDGMPVLGADEYWRIYETDMRKIDEAAVATFDFRGFVREDREGYLKQGSYYRDALATNGIRKGDGHDGIHVGTDGIVGYSDDNNHSMRGPNEVGEYVMYIRIPGAVQKELGVYCLRDSIHRVSDFDPTNERLSLDQIQASQQYVVIRLPLEPKEDPLARERAVALHTWVVGLLEKGDSRVAFLNNIVSEAANALNDMSQEELKGASRVLDTLFTEMRVVSGTQTAPKALT